MRSVYVLSSRCPLGCLYVVFVKRVTDGKPFAWCPTCGFAWFDPAKETWQLGEYGNAEPHATAISVGSVIDFADDDDVKRLGMIDRAQSMLQDQDWSKKLEDFNSQFGLNAAIRVDERPKAASIDARGAIASGLPKPMVGRGDADEVDLRVRHSLVDTIAVNLLIWFYLAAGILYVFFSAAVLFIGARWELIAKNRAHTEEVALIATLAFVMAFGLLLVAYGLWKRWRLVRLILIGLSLWSIAVCAFAATVALATIAGLTDGRILGAKESPTETLAIAAGFSALAGLQWWVPTRPAAREGPNAKIK